MDDITIQLYSFYGVDNDEELRVARRMYHSDRDLPPSSSLTQPVEVEDVEVEDGEI